MLNPSRDRLARLLRRFVTGVHIALALGLAIGTVRRMLTPGGIIDADFTVFRTAWWLILHGQGQALYDVSAQRTAQHLLMGGQEFTGGLMAFLNPPHAALAGLPLGWIADHAGGGLAFAIWACVNAFLVLRLDHLVRGLFGVSRGELRWTITFALLAFYPVFYTIAIGQFSLLLAVCVFELFRALEGQRPRAAAAWLMILSIKPQLLPPLLLLLVVRGHWRAIGWAAVWGMGVAAICAAILGGSIWFDYLRNVHALEQFFAAGTPAYMMNFRGALTRLLGQSASPAGIYLGALVAWAVAMLVLALVLIRRRAATGGNLRDELALALAVSLLFNPHLFPQDAVIWVVALTLYTAGRRGRRESWRLFSAFAFAWPIGFAFSRAIDGSVSGAPHLRLTPAMVMMVVALVWMTWNALQKSAANASAGTST